MVRGMGYKGYKDYKGCIKVKGSIKASEVNTSAKECYGLFELFRSKGVYALIPEKPTTINKINLPV